MSQCDDQNIECPLCMEPFEMDDFTFFPCTCGYQICRFCWHRIRTDENGLCPACRKQYPEDPADFKPLSIEEIQKIKTEKRQKDQQKKHKAFENKKHLADVRVVQKNLVFVVGLPARLADPELLKKHHYFGKYGRIHKVVVNHSTTYAGSQGPSASAYVTYYRPEDALSAIKNVNHLQIDGRTLKASLGTTKYCSYFLKNQQCPKTDCMYLHELGDEAASFTKDDMKQGKHQEYEKQLQDQYQVSVNKKEAPSPTSQKKSHSSKEIWPSAPHNLKMTQAKESKTDKQNRSKFKYTQSDSPKRKTKSKSGDVNQSNNSSVNSSKNEEDTNVPKWNSRPRNLFLKDSVNLSQSPLQRTEGPPAFRNTTSDDKELGINEMNNRNVQKTLLHIGEQSVYNQSMKCTDKLTGGDCPSFPSSPTSSSSSSLFTPFGSLSSNFMSSSPSPPLHSGDHLSLSPEENSQHDRSGDCSTNASPQNFVDTLTESSQCVTLSCAESDTNLDSQLSTLSVSPTCGSYGSPTSEHVVYKNEPETKAQERVGHSSSTSKTENPDDDLDFDPWEESSKGLGDLIAKEETVHQSSFVQSIPPGFSCRAHIPSHVPNSRITPPPGFIPLATNLKYDHPPGSLVVPLPGDKPFPSLSRKVVPASSMMNMEDTQSMQDGFRALLPNVNVTFSASIPQKGYYRENKGIFPHFAYGLEHTSGETAWHRRDTASTFPGRNTAGAVWRKTVNQVEDSGRFLNSSYSTPFALRGQWPSSQCPPPGFVVPYRPLENTPYQHAAVNQNDPKSKDGCLV